MLSVKQYFTKLILSVVHPTYYSLDNSDRSKYLPSTVENIKIGKKALNNKTKENSGDGFGFT